MIFNQPDILLLICPPWGVVNPPLGPAYLAANLKQKGLFVDVLDINAQLHTQATLDEKGLWLLKNDNFWRKAEQVDNLFFQWQAAVGSLAQKIVTSGVSVVGFTVIDPNEFFTCRFIKLLKERIPQLLVLAGGPGCEAQGQREFLSRESAGAIDYFFVGEGERVLAEFLLWKKRGGEVTSLSQVIPAGDESQQRNTIPQVDLESIVSPSFEEFDMLLYSGESLAVMWSRGCIGRCLYCKEKALWGRYRCRSVAAIVDELHFYVSRYAARNFVVYDSAINGNPKHLEAICEAIIADSLDITWSGEAIALKSLTEQLLSKMRRAGCHTLVYGIESGSDRVLTSMGKLSNSRDAGEVIRRTHKAGIKVAVNILVGFPGETEEDLQMTVDFLRRHARFIDRIDSVSTLQIVTDTPLAARIQDFDLVLPDVEPHDKWRSRDESNTYEIRQQRLQTILTVAGEEGFEIGRTFLNENRRTKESGRDQRILSQLWQKLKTGIGIKG
ncbi:MAG: radical SAM protein [Proteobacteria bacterium]|nr:radical SAM protein [Pseudomonadota bacterium]